MASTVSYANVAATGTAKSETSSNGALENGSETAIPVSNGSAAATNTPTSPDASSDVQSEDSSAPAATGETPKKEKKVLAPAPVPSKSAWGAAVSEPSQASVDEHKWPTPDKVPEQAQPLKAAKFIKPNKWVPIPAKVVLPSPRSSHSQGSGAANQQKNKRKNKTQKKKTPASPTSEDSILKKDDREPEANGEASHNGEFDEQEKFAVEQDQADQQGQLHNYNYQHDKTRYNNQGTPGQKNFKRFPQNGHPQQQNGKPAPPQQSRPRFYPQFVPSQYQNYAGARQFKPANGANGGQYRRSNSNGAIPNGYANGYNVMAASYIPNIPHHPQAVMGLPYGTPMPVQIPPPISPKQNPQQALTQQIDYYFSLENLIRDVFLRKNMGTEGWIELDLILNFKRIKIIVNGIFNSIEEADEEKRAQILDSNILHAVQQCQNVEIGYLNGKEHDNATATEVQLRVKNSFEQWLLPDN